MNIFETYLDKIIDLIKKANQDNLITLLFISRLTSSPKSQTMPQSPILFSFLNINWYNSSYSLLNKLRS